MICPECKEDSVKVVDTVYSREKAEAYRKRKWDICGYMFFTKEIEVPRSEELFNEWNKNYRGRKRKKSYSKKNHSNEKSKMFMNMYNNAIKNTKEEKIHI